MRVDWCVSSWFRIKNTHSLTSPRAMAEEDCVVVVVLMDCCSLAFFLARTAPLSRHKGGGRARPWVL